MKLTPQEEIIKIRQEMLAREVDAEVKNDQIKAFWKKYRFLFIGLAATVVAVVIGFELYTTWRHKVSLAESDRFESAVLMAYQGQTDEAIAQLDALATDSKTGYQYLADLKKASVLISKGENQAAFDLLTNLMNNTSAPNELRSVARLALAGHQIDTLEPTAVQALLQPLLNETNTFYGPAAELMAITYLAQDNPAGAKNILTQATQSNAVPENMKQRLSEFLSVIEA